MNDIQKENYLSRMSGAMQDKMRVLDFMDEYENKAILDVGCADGQVTFAISQGSSHWAIMGIDLDEGFIKKANQKYGFPGVVFRQVYLRDLLQEEMRYDYVTFMSVLHEFYSYGEGKSSVTKALADAHELLHSGGRVIIRDMILREHTKRDHWGYRKLEKYLGGSDLSNYAHNNMVVHEGRDEPGNFYDEERSLASINHFLLKSLYIDNWDHEWGEFYTAMTFEDYERIFQTLGMRIVHQESYLLPYLKEKWKEMFGIESRDMDLLRSTGIIVAQKEG